MIDISAEGRTVLLSSHQVSEVERVADMVAMVAMVAILLNGRLVCVERLEERKRHTTEVVLSLSETHAAPPPIPGISLAHVKFGHEHIWMLKDLDTNSLLESCRSVRLPEPQFRKPNLEDILLAMLREYRRDSVLNSGYEGPLIQTTP